VNPTLHQTLQPTLHQTLNLRVTGLAQNPLGFLAGPVSWIMSNYSVVGNAKRTALCVCAVLLGVTAAIYASIGGSAVARPPPASFVCISMLGVHEYNNVMSQCWHDNQGRTVDPVTGRAPVCVFDPTIRAFNERPDETELRYCVESKVLLTEENGKDLKLSVMGCMHSLVTDTDPESEVIVDAMNQCTRSKFAHAVQGFGLTLGEMEVTYGKAASDIERDAQIKDAMKVSHAGRVAADNVTNSCVQQIGNAIDEEMSAWYMYSDTYYVDEFVKCMRTSQGQLGSAAMVVFDTYIEDGKEMIKEQYEIVLMSDKMVSAVRWRNSGIGVGTTIATAAAFSVGLQVENPLCVTALAMYRQHWPAVYAMVTGAVSYVFQDVAIDGLAYVFRLDRESWKHELALLKSAGMNKAIWNELFRSLWDRRNRKVVVPDPEPDPKPDDLLDPDDAPSPPGKKKRPENANQRLRREKEKRDAKKAKKPVGADGRREVDPDAMQRSLDKAAKKLEAQRKAKAAKAAKDAKAKAKADEDKAKADKAKADEAKAKADEAANNPRRSPRNRPAAPAA
jgi:hypothetical protein